jgi:UDP-N-acetylglucosamine--N-acetylmuramyl-(pentapeptide) pyrophosphoryl-undecaprenol N-acetylglucosamine transferase
MVSAGEADVRRHHALVAGGGTGGHVFPALALAEELRQRGWAVSFVGRAGQMEERLATLHEIPFLALSAAPMVGTSVGQKVRTLWTILVSALVGRRLVRDSGARVVVGMGGYVSVPAVLGARLAGTPIVLFEPNATAGVANRWLARWATEATIAYPAAGASLVCPTVETGTPVRREFFEQPESPSGPGLGLLVLGGSQGSMQLNEMVPEALLRIEEQVDGIEGGLRVLHQAGSGNVEATRAAYEQADLDDVEVDVVGFLGDVAGAIAEAHLVISRAGAVTLAELCAVGRAAVLVPLELAGGHQRINAEALVEAGAAEILSPGGAADELATRLAGLLADPERMARMGAAGRRTSRADAAQRLADRVVAAGGAS